MPADYVKIQAAALALYNAGHWTCDRPVDEVKLWTDLRDALGLAPGGAPVPIQPPVTPPAGGIKANVPKKIDGYTAFEVFGLKAGTRQEVGDLRGIALVIFALPGVTEIKIQEYAGQPLDREYWVTPDPSWNPVWISNGGPSPSVKVPQGQFVVFRNKVRPPKPGNPPRPLDGTPSAVSAG